MFVNYQGTKRANMSNAIDNYVLGTIGKVYSAPVLCCQVLAMYPLFRFIVLMDASYEPAVLNTSYQLQTYYDNPWCTGVSYSVLFVGGSFQP